MQYDRYLDIHFVEGFNGPATFASGLNEQAAHQSDVRKVGPSGYKIMKACVVTMRRAIADTEYGSLISWVCNGAHGKIRINSHGSKLGRFEDNRGGEVTTEMMANFLSANGLTPDNIGTLRTINLAVCNGATGTRSQWMIKQLADQLKLPGVAFTGAGAVTKMLGGVLHVNDPSGPKRDSHGLYISPGKRISPFKKHLSLKQVYTYDPNN